MTDFTLGVNYWPRRKAMYWWSNFDAGEVREEFAILKERYDACDISAVGRRPARPHACTGGAQIWSQCGYRAENGLARMTFSPEHMSGPNGVALVMGAMPPSASQHAT